MEQHQKVLTIHLPLEERGLGNLWGYALHHNKEANVYYADSAGMYQWVTCPMRNIKVCRKS